MELISPRILNPKPGDWLTYNGNLSGNRYSELKQINAANVNKLGLKWTFSIPLWSQFLPDTPYYRENMRYFGLETVPIVADGIMYVTGPNQAFALDARTGHQIWQYSRPRTPGWSRMRHWARIAAWRSSATRSSWSPTTRT